MAGAIAGLGLAGAPASFVGPARAISLGDVLGDVTDVFRAKPALPPQRNTLEGHVPDLQGLARDNVGIIDQLQDINTLDGGDSVHRTGVAAFCNSTDDQKLLHLFEHDGIMVRHLTHVPWDNCKNCTRDQLIGYTAGCWRAGFFDINQRLLHAHVTRFPPHTCQDTEKDYPGTTNKPPIEDPLEPNYLKYWQICANQNGAFKDSVGQL